MKALGYAQTVVTSISIAGTSSIKYTTKTGDTIKEDNLVDLSSLKVSDAINADNLGNVGADRYAKKDDLKIHNLTFYGYSYANEQVQQYFSFSLISSKSTSLTSDEIRTIIINAGCIDYRNLIPATGVDMDMGKYYTITGVFCKSTSNSISWCYAKNDTVETGGLPFNMISYKDAIYSLE